MDAFVDNCWKNIAPLVFFCYYVNVFSCGQSSGQKSYSQTVDKMWIFINTLFILFSTVLWITFINHAKLDKLHIQLSTGLFISFHLYLPFSSIHNDWERLFLSLRNKSASAWRSVKFYQLLGAGARRKKNAIIEKTSRSLGCCIFVSPSLTTKGLWLTYYNGGV